MKQLNESINCKEKIDIEDIEYIEKKYKFSFPEEIKNYYLQHNGGTLKKTAFIKNKVVYRIDYFYPIKYERYNLEKILNLVDEDNTPSYLIPIATDEGGDEFCFSTREGEEGRIYYLSHEFYDKSDPQKGVHLLADNLIEFVNEMTNKKR